ncbi:hypothetical protein [Streptomyces sp. YIM S03343]
MTEPLTTQQLDEITARAKDRRAALTEWINRNSPQPGQQALENAEAVLEEDIPALLADNQHLRQQLETARSQAITWAADLIDEQLTAEPDHDRASALYELLLRLRGELPCTCARCGGLHAKECSKYVPGHELISRHDQLAVYRAAARPAATTQDGGR